MNNNSINNRLVSIIMNCRNGQEYLHEALDSIYAQSYTNWEIIFWDNASIDNSAAIAKSYDSRLRYFRTKTAVALGQARNLAMAQVRGEYLTFLDCDDLWLKQKLSKQVSLMIERKDIDFIYSNYYRVIMPQDDCLILELHGRQPEGRVFGFFLTHYPVNLQTVMVRMDAINRLNAKFDDSLELSEEFDFFMRILLKSKVLYINEPLAIYRVHQNMNSLRLTQKHPFEMKYTLDKLVQLDPSIKKVYASEIQYYEAKLGYWLAKAKMDKNNQVAARRELAPFKFVDTKFFVLYLSTFLPTIVWKKLHHYKMEGKFRWIS